MKVTSKKIFAIIPFVALFIGACTGSTPDPAEVEVKVKVRVAATLTQQAILTAERSTQEAESLPAPTDTPPPPTDTAAPSPTPTLQPTLTPTVEHVMKPPEPLEKINSHLTDVSSLGYAAEGYTYGDQYLINRFERPFTSQTMQYQGYLDITLTNLTYSPPWVYFIITLQEDLPESGEPLYGVELDLDEDGRGETFVAASLPPGTEWTTDGVVVYRDIDGDVGGPNPIVSDAPTSGLTGYEVVIFDSGRGEDPDLAWARRDPEASNQLQIAFKDALVGASGYLWSIWADEGPRDLSLADYNDKWQFEEAGSPFPDHDFYPLKELALVDSTCRSWYGFEPTGKEPGLCAGYFSDTDEVVMGYCPQYLTHVVDCDEVCLAECPSGAAYCIPCEISD